MKRLHHLILGNFFFTLALLNWAPHTCADTIELDGLIEPYLIIKVGSPVAGVLKTVQVDRGAKVKKKQTLATLESGVEKATMILARARAKMDSSIKAREARLNFSLGRQQRYKELYRKKAIPLEEMDEAKTNASMALMELEEAKENKRLAELEWQRSIQMVKRRTIASPIEGVVTQRYMSPGELVEDQPILKLAQINPLNVEVFAPVELLGAIKVGMNAEVRPEASGSSVHTAKVNIVDQVVDAASSTFGIRLTLPNPK